MAYPNTDYQLLGLSPRWVFVVLSAPTTVYLTAGTVSDTFTAIAGDSSGFTPTASIKSLAEITQQCDWFSGLQAASGFDIQLNDVSAEYSTLIKASPQDFIGKEIVLYIYFAENTPSALDSDYEVWRGYVDDFSFDEVSCKISCADASLRKVENKKIPNNSRLIEAGTYVPDNAVGKCYPVVYGEVTRSPLLMTKDKRDKVIHIGVCTGVAGDTLTICWISSTFPTLNSLANKYMKVIYGTDRSSVFTGESNDDSLVGAIKKITSNTAPSGAGVGELVMDSEFPHSARDWNNSDNGIVFEILDADMEYSAWRIMSGDNFAYSGFQAENGTDEPVFVFDSDTIKFLQLDPTQYVKTTSSVGGHTLHIIDFDVSFLLGRDQLNLIVDYVELNKIFDTAGSGSHSIQQFDAGAYLGIDYTNEDNSIDDNLATSAQLDTNTIGNVISWNTNYKEIHWDLMYLYKYLQENNREQINFSRVFITLKLDYDLRALSGAAGNVVNWYLELRAESRDKDASEATNTPPQAAHILKKKTILKAAATQPATVTGSLNGIPEFIDSGGDDDTYRDIRVELESVTDIKGLINKHAALVLIGGGVVLTTNHRDIIDIYSVGVVFERQIALADQKVFYGNVMGRKDFASDALISAGTYQNHPYFCVAHALIAENNFADTDFSLDTSDSTAFGFTLTEQVDTISFLESAAKQTASKILVDKDGIWSNSKYDSTKTFKVSGTTSPADLDIFDQTGAWNTGTGKFTKHPILDISDIKLTPTDDCYSNFVVQYNYNYATQKYDGMLYIYSDGTTNLVDGDLENHAVTDLQTLISNSPADSDATLKLELDMVRDRVTAGTVLERYLERLYKRWWTFTFRTWWSAFEYNIGDIINVQHQMIGRLFASYTTKRWEIVEKTLRSGGGVDFTVVEN